MLKTAQTLAIVPPQEPRAPEPRWPEPPMLIEETRGSPFGYRSRKIPESPRLAELAAMALKLGGVPQDRR